MNRRDSLKALGLTTLSTGILLTALDAEGNEVTKLAETPAEPGREAFEIERNKKLNAEIFFDKHEMATITILADIIIPRDSKSGSASEAKVPAFIEFIVKDIPSHKVPMRGGLKWLDLESLKRFEKPFISITPKQRIEIVDDIAYPDKAKPEMKTGVTFFNRIRSLTISGFYTTEIGIKDVGYKGNTPNQWEGVPADVLKQYGMENVKI
jgi:hypothetical protein